MNRLTGVAYKDDPTILAWELMNEPRLANYSTGATLQVIVFASTVLPKKKRTFFLTHTKGAHIHSHYILLHLFYLAF